MYTVYVYCKQSAPVQTHCVYMLCNITLRLVCCFSWSVWTFWEQSGVEATTALSAARAWTFGPGVLCVPADRRWTDGLLTSPATPFPNTVILEVSSTLAP